MWRHLSLMIVIKMICMSILEWWLFRKWCIDDDYDDDDDAYGYGDHDDDVYDDENATYVLTMIKIIME